MTKHTFGTVTSTKDMTTRTADVPTENVNMTASSPVLAINSLENTTYGNGKLPSK